MSVVLPKRSAATVPSIYAPLGMRDLPFPTEPIVNLYSEDPRVNGAIFATEPVAESIDKFEQMLIAPGDFENRSRLAYLWSKGDTQSGRGVGKTALLRYFRQRINKDWGTTVFEGRFSAVVIYAGFASQVDRRYNEQLAASALNDICKNGVLDAGRAALRYEALSDAADKIVARPDGEPEYALLLDDDAIRAEGIDPEALDAQIARRLMDAHVASGRAFALAQGKFEDYLRSLRRDRNLEPLYIPHDLKLLELSRVILFSDFVRFLREAGFRGGYLFIDDIENLVDQMTRKACIAFAKEFAIMTVRPGYENSNYRFFSCVLTTHQQASLKLAQAWAEAGLAAIAPLDPRGGRSIELPYPDPAQGRQMVVAHLDYYRLDKSENGTIKPFTEDGMAELLGSGQTVHPRQLLTRAAAAMRRAAADGQSGVDAGTVKAASEAVQVAEPDFTEGIEGAL